MNKNNLKTVWQTKKLGEVCDIINGSTPLRSNKSFWDFGDISWFTVDDIREQGRVIRYTKQKITKKALTKCRLLPPKTILLCCTASVGEYAISDIELATNQQFNGLVIKDKKYIDPVFLFYFSSTLKDELLGLSGKTTIDFIPISRLKGIEIHIPPLSEQNRIVKMLDETFEKIEKARQNAVKNLKNSRDLFDSYLNNFFANPGDDWKEKKLKEVCIKLFAGGDVPKNNFSKVKNNKYNIPIFANGFKNKGLFGYTNIEKVIEPCITISARGTIGYAEIREEPFFPVVRLIVLVPDTKIVDLYFLYYMTHNFKFSNTGTSIPQLTIPMIENIVIPVPDIKEQKNIITKLDKLSAETKKLEAIYKQKLADLEELKKSVLKKAFNGEL